MLGTSVSQGGGGGDASVPSAFVEELCGVLVSMSCVARFRLEKNITNSAHKYCIRGTDLVNNMLLYIYLHMGATASVVTVFAVDCLSAGLAQHGLRAGILHRQPG